jgi:hypothetical protein
MIRPSFIPSRAIRDLRDFTRRRKQMIGAAAQERNRVQKILEDANVKIGDVLTDVFGLSGQLMLEALVKGLDGKGQPSAFDIAQTGTWPREEETGSVEVSAGRSSDAKLPSDTDPTRNATYGIPC